MSEHWICAIPRDPRHVPVATEDLERLMHSLMPRADQIEMRSDPGVQFRDCGENFESVRCPECGAEIATAAWQKLMEVDFIDPERGFRVLDYPMPCCGRTRSINDLVYAWPQGLSRFIISAMNPDRGHLSSDEIRQLEQAMGCPVTIIYQHI